MCDAAPITSPFGWRTHPITGEWKFHSGVDIGYDYGTDITAMLPGTVVYAAPWDGYGNCVILEHENGDHTLYGHCSEIYVSYGQYVNKGDVIAAVGSTGNSTGPHLHLEWWHNGGIRRSVGPLAAVMLIYFCVRRNWIGYRSHIGKWYLLSFSSFRRGKEYLCA